MAQAVIDGVDGASSPLPQAGKAVVLRTSAVLTAAWVATSVVSVKQARKFTLLIAYAADASGTANRPQLRVMASCEENVDTANVNPDVDQDVWYAPCVVDASPTAGVLIGTKETGATATVLSPTSAVVVARPLVINVSDGSTAGTDVLRYALTFDVTPYRYVYVAAKELGDIDAGDLGVLGLKYSLSL